MECTSVNNENITTPEEEEVEELEEISDDDIEKNINSTSMYKNTNLHFSSALGIIDTFSQDIEAADQKIDAENFMGWTPLMMAVRNGHIDIAKILLEKGADITKKNKLGMNIFSMSVASGKLEMAEIVLRHMLRGGISRNKIQENISPLSLTLLFENTHLVKWLLCQGFDVNAVTPRTNLSPLMFAAVTKTTSALDLLEAKATNKNHKNYMGLNYQAIKIWKQRGLQYLQEQNMVKQRPKITKKHEPPIIVTTTPDSITKPKENIFQKQTPIQKKNDMEEGISYEVKLKVPNNTPCSNHTAKEMNKRNDQLLNKLHAKLENVEVGPPVELDEYSNSYEESDDQNNRTEQQLRDSTSAEDYSDDFQPKSSFQPPSSAHYPNYVHYMNSAYDLHGMGSPAAPITPIMIVPQYSNFLSSVSNVPQNSPMNFIPSPHNFYPNGVASPHLFFPTQIADMNQFNYDNPHSYSGIYNNSMYYQLFSPARHVYPFTP